MNMNVRHSIHNIWYGMIRRCYDTKCRNYNRYGGRGITVCEEWKNSFKAFLNWAVLNGYRKGLTIDRIDNNLGYSPENCRWATHKEQNRNYSRNHIITVNGESMCIADWADKTGIKPATILARIKRGWSVDKLFDEVHTMYRHRDWSGAE